MLTLNHLEILQLQILQLEILQLQILKRVRTLATDILTTFAAGIVLLSFAPSHAQSAPRIDFQAPISSHECRERLRSFGTSDAGIELAMPAIEAYIKLALQAPVESTAIALAFFPSPLELSEATELQNRFEHQLAQCDAADAQLGDGDGGSTDRARARAVRGRRDEAQAGPAGDAAFLHRIRCLPSPPPILCV